MPARCPQSLANLSRTSAIATPRGLSHRSRRELAGAIRTELRAHVGGNPSAVQRELIESAVQIKLRLAEMDRQYARSGDPPDPADRGYLDWRTAYARVIRQLGLRGAPPRVPTLAELAEGARGAHARARAAALAATSAPSAPAPAPAASASPARTMLAEAAA